MDSLEGGRWQGRELHWSEELRWIDPLVRASEGLTRNEERPCNN